MPNTNILDAPSDLQHPTVTKFSLVNQRFGRLIVVGKAGKSMSGHQQWVCLCDCGNTSLVRQDHLRSGASQSCGCLIKVTRATTHGHTRNGLTSPEYRSWRDMIQRCTNSKRK